MVVRFEIMREADFQERTEERESKANIRMDVPEDKNSPGAHPFWAPFSWIMGLMGGALFWYWIIGCILRR